MKDIKIIPMPALKILNYAGMMAKNRGWKVGKDFESVLRMKDMYLTYAAKMN